MVREGLAVGGRDNYLKLFNEIMIMMDNGEMSAY